MRDFEKDEELEEIIQFLRDIPRVEPSGGLTQKVMERLPYQRPPFLSRAKHLLLTPKSIFNTVRKACTWEEDPGICPLYFLGAGLFHLVIGTLVIAGLARLTKLSDALVWPSVFMPITLFLGILLALLGLTLFKEKGNRYGMVRIGTHVYTIIAAISGLAAAAMFENPYISMAALFLAGAGVLIGLTLERSLQKFRRNPENA